MNINQVEELWFPERDRIREEMGYGLGDEWGESVIQAAERLSFCYARGEYGEFEDGPHYRGWIHAYEQMLASIIDCTPFDFSAAEREWWARYRAEHPEYDMERAQSAGRLF